MGTNMNKSVTRKYLNVIIIAVLFTLGCLLLLFSLNAINRAGNKPRKFGATYMTMSNPYFKVMDNSIKAVVESNGDILISRDPALDQEKQNSHT
jgi:ribose transport system substrate-binding protein